MVKVIKKEIYNMERTKKKMEIERNKKSDETNHKSTTHLLKGTTLCYQLSIKKINKFRITQN
jgi:hypothetical protein